MDDTNTSGYSCRVQFQNCIYKLIVYCRSNSPGCTLLQDSTSLRVTPNLRANHPRWRKKKRRRILSSFSSSCPVPHCLPMFTPSGIPAESKSHVLDPFQSRLKFYDRTKITQCLQSMGLHQDQRNTVPDRPHIFRRFNTCKMETTPGRRIPILVSLPIIGHPASRFNVQ